MEGILDNTSLDLPGLEGVEEVVISKEVVEQNARPLYIYADRAAAGDAGVMPEGAPAPWPGTGLAATAAGPGISTVSQRLLAI